jgi:hypothetical protein
MFWDSFSDRHKDILIILFYFVYRVFNLYLNTEMQQT